ncbi:MAG: PAS domain S-box protein [Sulfuritalea sp.]|nr:PAS domain S-box protein [Sulfuritalea sp.]
MNAFFRQRSIKTRVTLFTLAIFLAGIWALSLFASRELRADMERILGNQQFSTVSLLANELDHELNDRLTGLEGVAKTISPAMLSNAATLLTFLEHHPILQRLFNGGLIVVRSDGMAIVEVAPAVGRVGVNYMDIDTVAAALREGKSTIGRPVMGKKLQAPVFGISAPIRDAQGRTIGALSGVINLGLPNFLDKIVQNSYGKTGGYVLLIPKDRLTVTATDRTRIMQPLPARGINPALDRFLAGYDGYAVYTNPLGAEVLGSAKGMPMSGWLLGLTLPTTEAFAPIYTLQQRVLLATILLTLLAGGLTWLMLRRELGPMVATAGKLAAMADAKQPLLPLPVTGHDEVAQLIGGFNHLLEALAQRKTILRESEARYRNFFESSPDAILVHRGSTVIFANERAAKLFHADSAATLIGQDWHPLFATEYWDAIEQRIAMLASGKSSLLVPLERRFSKLDGDSLIMEATGTRIIFDGQPAILSVFRDISERKRAEEQRLADARQQRDTLVREVHHRIKNNLQGVAGLLQRELGRFVELDPRLETAISQVHAIAMVHGLQSRNPDEAIRLCDSVSGICKAVSDLSQLPVLFSIEHEQTVFRPVRIDNSEAVSVALVLNELILNAVKHSPQGSAAPTVSLSADGSSAQLLIRNAVSHAPEFNIDTGTGLGTGLRLVRSLLPDQGVQLSYETDAANFMLTRLRLTAPVVTNQEPGP